MSKSKARLLKDLITADELLVMPGIFDPISARVVERGGWKAAQCTGLGISGAHLGLPDYSFMSLNDMVDRTRRITAAVSIPVMADGDTGFGNAVNTHYSVKAFEAAGAAGVNLEDQVMPKRCGHLEGKQIVSMEEGVMKLRAAADARQDPDFVINARTDALAVVGIEEVVRRGNAYLEAGATMIFVDGISSRAEIEAAVSGIGGPVAINLVEGGRSPRMTFAELQRIGVARVSLPLTLFSAAIRGMQDALAAVREADGVADLGERLVSFSEVHEIVGMPAVSALEEKYAVTGG